MIIDQVEGSDLRRIRHGAATDARGTFTRLWCARAFAEAGLVFTPVQASTATTRLKGTIRGLHWQDAPFAEAKLVRCVRGAIHDVAVDLRPGSPTRGRAFSVQLSEDGNEALFIPEGFAHGYQALCDTVVVDYLMSAPYAPDHARGARFDDPAFGVAWPLPVTMISDRDAAFAPFRTVDAP